VKFPATADKTAIIFFYLIWLLFDQHGKTNCYEVSHTNWVAVDVLWADVDGSRHSSGFTL